MSAKEDLEKLFLQITQEDLMFNSEIALLDGIELKNITLEDIEQFGELTTGKLNLKDLKDKRIISKYNIMRVLYELFNSPNISAGLLLQQLPLQSREELREVLKNVLLSHLTSNYFQHVLAAFQNEEGSYYYPQLFAYLSKNGDDKLLLSFIKWTSKNLRLDHHYHRGLKNYLISHPRSIWKNKSARKELQNIHYAGFRKLVKEVRNETANPVHKFFKKYGVHVSIVLLITLVVGSGLYLGNDLIADKNEKTALLKSINSTATEPAETKKEDTTLDPFTKWVGESPFVFNVNGEQQQITFGQSNPMGGKSLVLTDSKRIDTPFELVIDSEVSPFDENGMLKEGFSLYHTGHDFDANGTPEVVIMALNQTFESFVWVYSPYSPTIENGSVGLRADLAVTGMSKVKLVDNTLTLLVDLGLSETYAYENQQFVKK